MKRFAPIIGILVLIGLLALLNKSMNKTAVRDDDDATVLPPAAAAKSTVAAQDPLPPEMTLGNAGTAQYKITLGWVYDSATQTDPAALTQAVDAVKQSVAASGGRMSAEIVNLDMPAKELSPQSGAVTGLGVAINGNAGATVAGKEIALAGNPGEGTVSAANITAVLKGVLGSKP